MMQNEALRRPKIGLAARDLPGVLCRLSDRPMDAQRRAADAGVSGTRA